MDHQERGSKDDSFIGVALLVGIILSVPFILWFINHAVISYWGLYFCWLQLAMLDWPFFPWAGTLRSEIATMANQADAVTFGELFWYLTQSGIVGGWLPILVSVLTIRTTLRHRAEKVRRNITAATLPEIMSEHCPAVIPVLYYGNLLNENIRGQESREHPAEFAKRNKLVNEGILDENQTKKLFIAKLGEKISSLSELNIYERALFAIFASRVFDVHENGYKAQEMLDKLNRSCHDGKWNGAPGYPDFSVIHSEIAFYSKNPEAQALLKYFQYSSTYLHMLHLRAVERGKLVSSNFRWLKAMDRSLWYVLNTTGRKVPCIESLIQIQTYRTEHLAWQRGLRLVDAPLDQCVIAFKKALIKDGVLPKIVETNEVTTEGTTLKPDNQ